MATITALYDGEVAFTDHEIGRLLDGIAASARSPTLVAVTSDHGEEFGDHGGLQHGLTLWDEQLRVPLVLAGLGFAHRVVEQPVSLVSLPRTLVDLAGVLRVPGVAGPSLAKASRGAPVPPPDILFADLTPHIPGIRQLHHRAVIDGRWKLLLTHADAVSLFDLATDPREQREVGAAGADRVRTLTSRLLSRDAAAELARASLTSGTLALTPERRERLRALGYVP